MERATVPGIAMPRQAVQALRAGLGDHLVAVVLFGSRARGDHRPDSDWDLLVIAEQLPEKALDRHLALKSMLPPTVRGTTTILAKTAAEFEAHLPALYLDIAIDGKILYDPRGYASERLASLRRLIDRAGLYRERTAEGDVWQWRNPPSKAWILEWEHGR